QVADTEVRLGGHRPLLLRVDAPFVRIAPARGRRPARQLYAERAEVLAIVLPEEQRARRVAGGEGLRGGVHGREPAVAREPVFLEAVLANDTDLGLRLQVGEADARDGVGLETSEVDDRARTDG